VPDDLESPPWHDWTSDHSDGTHAILSFPTDSRRDNLFPMHVWKRGAVLFFELMTAALAVPAGTGCGDTKRHADHAGGAPGLSTGTSGHGGGGGGVSGGAAGHAGTGGGTTLFDDPGAPNDIAVDDGFIYWVNYQDGKLQRIPKAGGTPLLLARFPQYSAHYLDVDGSYIYVDDGDDRIVRIPKGGGAPEILTQPQVNPQSLRVDDSGIYWLTGTSLVGSEGGVVTTALDGGETRTLTHSRYVGPGKLTLDADTVYFSIYDQFGEGQGSVYRVAKAGGTPEVAIATGLTSPYALVVVGPDLFVTTGASTGQDGSILRFSKTAVGLPPGASLVHGQLGLIALASDGESLFWLVTIGSLYGGSVLTVPIAGGVPRVLSNPEQLDVALAVDDAYVYWINSSTPNGSVRRVPKN